MKTTAEGQKIAIRDQLSERPARRCYAGAVACGVDATIRSMQTGDAAPDLNEIADRYDRMNDKALLDIGRDYDSLIPEVQSLFHEELARRGLKLPEAEPSPVASNYPNMSNAALMREAQRYENLAPGAQALLRDEFLQRGLEPPLIDNSEEVSNDPGELEFQPLVKIREYRDSGEAMVAKGALESAGIKAVLWNATTVRVDWLWSNLLGGIRLMVDKNDVEAAEAVLSQPIPESIVTDTGEVYQQPHCPRCHSLNVHHETLDQRLKAGVLLTTAVPIPARTVDYWKCSNCGAMWTDDGETDEHLPTRPVA